jgi:hypothetical protein
MLRIMTVVSVALLANVAWAATIDAGGTQYKDDPSLASSPTYSADRPLFADGANLVGTLTAPIQLGFEGEVVTNVYAEPVTGFLTFEYTIALTDMNTAAIVRATLGGWQDLLITNIGADASGSSGTFDPSPEWVDGDPALISRTPNSNGLEFQFRTSVDGVLTGTVVGPGDVSSIMFVSTEVLHFDQSTMALIDTSVVGSAAVLTPVPEPASLFLMASALIGMVVLRRS